MARLSYTSICAIIETCMEYWHTALLVSLVQLKLFEEQHFILRHLWVEVELMSWVSLKLQNSQAIFRNITVLDHD